MAATCTVHSALDPFFWLPYPLFSHSDIWMGWFRQRTELKEQVKEATLKCQKLRKKGHRYGSHMLQKQGAVLLALMRQLGKSWNARPVFIFNRDTIKYACGWQGLKDRLGHMASLSTYLGPPFLSLLPDKPLPVHQQTGPSGEPATAIGHCQIHSNFLLSAWKAV